VLASEIEELDFAPLLRAADETPPDGADGVLARQEQMLDLVRGLR
jgi:hypothetical protein